MDSHQELYLPLDVVKSSPGFSFDIGKSMLIFQKLSEKNENNKI